MRRARKTLRVVLVASIVVRAAVVEVVVVVVVVVVDDVVLCAMPPKTTNYSVLLCPSALSLSTTHTHRRSRCNVQSVQNKEEL